MYVSITVLAAVSDRRCRDGSLFKEEPTGEKVKHELRDARTGQNDAPREDITGKVESIDCVVPVQNEMTNLVSSFPPLAGASSSLIVTESARPVVVCSRRARGRRSSLAAADNPTKIKTFASWS